MTPQRALQPRTDAVALLGGFFRVRSDPEPFLAGLAHRAIDRLPVPLEDRLILDLGCGVGHLAIELRRRGYKVVSADLRFADLVQGRPPGAFCGDATELSVRSASIDGVICSNILEHTPTPDLVFDEIARILRPGGWAWVSWTPWWTPFGGHAIAPFHYLGADRGKRVYKRLIGEPRGAEPAVRRRLADHGRYDDRACRDTPPTRAGRRVTSLLSVAAMDDAVAAPSGVRCVELCSPHSEDGSFVADLGMTEKRVCDDHRSPWRKRLRQPADRGVVSGARENGHPRRRRSTT